MLEQPFLLPIFLAAHGFFDAHGLDIFDILGAQGLHGVAAYAGIAVPAARPIKVLPARAIAVFFAFGFLCMVSLPWISSSLGFRTLRMSRLPEQVMTPVGLREFARQSLVTHYPASYALP
ncbi:hypothetical protein BJI67_00100 [Acidihalobacter aeolianus]|uniref:Uncharacterized protein n=1 Tax=Acidihalobacter aeolianus TaxID=2792603 RepID=A0A1D8K425_9GAMM|nr:hypothetical protein BJI67_00100 [Acidihalobacter aeolianus]